MTAPAYTKTCKIAKKNASSKTNKAATLTRETIINKAAETGCRDKTIKIPPPSARVEKNKITNQPCSQERLENIMESGKERKTVFNGHSPTPPHSFSYPICNGHQAAFLLTHKVFLYC